MSRLEFETEPIEVITAADEPYAVSLAAMVRSLITHHRSAAPLTVRVLDGGLSAQTRSRLGQSWPGGGVVIDWIPARHADLPDLPVWGRMRQATYLRLLAPTVLPASVKRTVWLDADLLVLRDIAELWAQPQGEAPLLAVQDMVVPYLGSRYGIAAYRQLGLDPWAKHFNAGVMVMDMNRWRLDDICRHAMEYLARYRRQVWFWDQEGLNAVLSGRWRELDPRWNQIASVAGRAFWRPRHLDTSTYRHVVSDPWIVHFAGTWKPWLCRSSSPSHQLFFKYVDMTAWAGWRPPKTLGTVASGLYESMIRDYLYPAERLWMTYQRRRSAKSEGLV